MTERSIDPQTRELLAELTADSPDAPGEPSLDELRAPWPADDPGLLPPRPLPAATDLLVPGDPSVSVRVYTPAVAAPRPALVWLHPGGFVSGDLEDIDGICRTLAIDGRCTVVSVAYRLAPEHPYPAALDDVMLALHWVRANAASLGIDGSRVAIGGQSAGATLAAACTLRLRESGAEQPAFQVLAYPVLDPSRSGGSWEENADGFLFTTRRMGWTWKQYLGGVDPVPAQAAPLLADDLTGLPDALVIAAGLDPARDDSRRYAERLSSCGVDAELVEYEGTIHAFLSFAGQLDVGKQALALIAERLRARFATDGMRLQHVTLPYAPEHADAMRSFYAELLGLEEKPVPDAFAGRQFIWFHAGPNETELHLIPEPAEPSQSDRHACLETQRLDDAVAALRAAGHHVERYDDIPSRPQAFVHDPSQNLIELTTLGDAARPR